MLFRSDNVFSGDDLLLGQKERKHPLQPDSSYQQIISVSAPTDYSGNYYLFVVTDQTNRIPETNNANNTTQPAFPLVVNAKPLPDVKVLGITANKTTLQPGDTVDISWFIENIGNAITTGGWTEKVAFISLSGIRVNLSGTPQFTGILKKDSSISRSYRFLLPEILNFSGDAYIEVELIPSNGLIENPGNTANNKATSQSRIKLLNKIGRASCRERV